MWPIVAIINNLPPSLRKSKANIQLIALWSGKQQPNLQKFVTPLLEHFSILNHKGISIQYKENDVIHEIYAKVHISNWMLDLKAKALLQNFKSSGYYCCGYCNIEGIYIQGTVVFPPTQYQSSKIEYRTHESICSGEYCTAAKALSSGEIVGPIYLLSSNIQFSSKASKDIVKYHNNCPIAISLRI